MPKRRTINLVEKFLKDSSQNKGIIKLNLTLPKEQIDALNGLREMLGKEKFSLFFEEILKSVKIVKTYKELVHSETIEGVEEQEK